MPPRTARIAARARSRGPAANRLAGADSTALQSGRPAPNPIRRGRSQHPRRRRSQRPPASFRAPRRFRRCPPADCRAQCQRIGRARSRDAVVRPPEPPQVLNRGQHPRRRMRRLKSVPPPHEAHAISHAEAEPAARRGVEQAERSAADQSPAARRRQRINTCLRAADSHAAGGNELSRGGESRRGDGRRQPGQVRKTRGKAYESDLVIRRGVQLHHPLGRKDRRGGPRLPGPAVSRAIAGRDFHQPGRCGAGAFACRFIRSPPMPRFPGAFAGGGRNRSARKRRPDAG